MAKTYKIMRNYRERGKRARKIKGGLSLDEAKAHCLDPKTRGKNWFDGFDEEKPRKRK